MAISAGMAHDKFMNVYIYSMSCPAGTPIGENGAMLRCTLSFVCSLLRVVVLPLRSLQNASELNGDKEIEAKELFLQWTNRLCKRLQDQEDLHPCEDRLLYLTLLSEFSPGAASMGPMFSRFRPVRPLMNMNTQHCQLCCGILVVTWHDI